jgi:hypothetical protein
MAEIELAVLSSQCLDRRIPDIATLTAEVAAWEEERNQMATTIDWRFTTADALDRGPAGSQRINDLLIVRAVRSFQEDARSSDHAGRRLAARDHLLQVLPIIG